MLKTFAFAFAFATVTSLHCRLDVASTIFRLPKEALVTKTASGEFCGFLSFCSIIRNAIGPVICLKPSRNFWLLFMGNCYVKSAYDIRISWLRLSF